MRNELLHNIYNLHPGNLKSQTVIFIKRCLKHSVILIIWSRHPEMEHHSPIPYLDAGRMVFIWSIFLVYVDEKHTCWSN
jgi:hypothetical protein